MSFDEKLERMLAGPMVWMSTLHAAVEVWRARADRRSGIDASELEPPDDARRRLTPALRQIEELAFRLDTLQVAMNEAIEEASALVARFDTLMILNRCGQLLEDIHRRLLSLYPEPDEDLIEDVRKLAVRCRESVEADDVELTVDDLFRVSDGVRRIVLARGF